MENQNPNQINKDWFHRHKLFLATITLVILLSGIIFDLQIEHRRKNWNLNDFPVHQVKTEAK